MGLAPKDDEIVFPPDFIDPREIYREPRETYGQDCFHLRSDGLLDNPDIDVQD